MADPFIYMEAASGFEPLNRGLAEIEQDKGLVDTDAISCYRGCMLCRAGREFQDTCRFEMNTGQAVWPQGLCDGNDAQLPVKKQDIDGETHAEGVYAIAGPYP